jgi:hypothetical protein
MDGRILTNVQIGHSRDVVASASMTMKTSTSNPRRPSSDKVIIYVVGTVDSITSGALLGAKAPLPQGIMVFYECVMTAKNTAREFCH